MMMARQTAMRTLGAAWCALAVSTPGPGAAQPVAAAGAGSILPGHSQQGHLFSDGPRQEARLMRGMPRVHFPITCRFDGKAAGRKGNDRDVQAFFDQGVGQLHGFWNYEAERSFRQVAVLSPTCAVAYWGMAMAAVSNEGRAVGFIKKAVARRGGADAREKLWIDSLAAFHEVTEAESAGEGDAKAGAAPLSSANLEAPQRVYTKPSLERMKEYIKALEGITEAYPSDLEAKAFLVIAIWDAEAKFFRFWDKAMGDGLPIPSREAVHALADQVLAKNPLHPIHHYLIHLWDGPRARRAVDAAFKAGPSGPGIPHMWHMAGHTLSKLKRFGDATWQQEAAARLDHAYMIADDIFPDQIHNYAHNNDWLVSDLAITGRVHDALALAKNLVEIPRHPQWNDLGGKKKRASRDALAYTYATEKGENSASFGRKRMFEVLVEFELWNELLALKDGPLLEPTDLPDEQWKRLLAIALANVRTRRLAAAEAGVAEAKALLVDAQKKPALARAEAAEKARAEKLDSKEIEKRAAEAEKRAADGAKQKQAQVAEIGIELALAEGRAPEAAAVALVEQFPRPRRAELLFRLGKRDEAIKVSGESVTQADSELPPLARHAELLWRAGRQAEAESVFARLLPLASRADLDTPIFARLLPIARAKGLPEDWRPRHTIDGRNMGKGPRVPALDSFGPAMWHPPLAPDFSFPGSDGKLISRRDYAGRPVIVIFYLGNGCLHCLEQLRAFYPLQKKFKEAGIELLAVSTDSVDGLRQTITDTVPKERLTFPLASDSKLTAFRAFRAYDGFEKTPLHGTFLIDGGGLIRWHDISFAPFTQVEFLLKESIRLLRTPVVLPRAPGKPAPGAASVALRAQK